MVFLGSFPPKFLLKLAKASRRRSQLGISWTIWDLFGLLRLQNIKQMRSLLIYFRGFSTQKR